ncbi:MAG: phosphotransferase enzyme family protein [Desulfobaccales bacterium]
MRREQALSHLLAAAAQFAPAEQILEVEAYGQGNVHDTFLVRGRGVHLRDGEAAGETHFILQRLNTRVFRRPEQVLANFSTCTGHLRRRLAEVSPGPGRRWEVPRALPSREGADHWLDPGGSFWRAISFIENAQSLEVIRDLEHAREVGYALGLFQALLSDLDPASLADTLPGFHETPGYLRHFDEVLTRQGAGPSPEVAFGLRCIGRRRGWAGILEEAKAEGWLKLRPIHGDPKVNNVMVDRTSGQAVALVDLDTVKPGLVHYDIGDCLRSGCNPLGEEIESWETVRFDPDICRAILRGYLSRAGGFLTGTDYEYLYDAIRLIAFELGLRFFTDYLEGNIYFKVRDPEQNLIRALAQFMLTESVEAQERTIRAIIRDLR